MTNRTNFLINRAKNEIERQKIIYGSLNPVSGLERDFMMKLRNNWEILEELVKLVQSPDEDV